MITPAPIHPKKIRFLWAYHGYSAPVRAWNDQLTQRRRALGYDVENFNVALPSLNGSWLSFEQLDRKWRDGDSELLGMYERLEDRLRSKDALILFNGVHLHPEFVRHLNVFKAYHCSDDPESSQLSSRPTAPAFDLALVSNIACVTHYLAWGVPEAHFYPLGSQLVEEDVADLTEEAILDPSRRDVPLFMACERQMPFRRARLDQLAAAFPEAQFVGRGWPRAYIPKEEVQAIYRRTQIGWNIHNSTGPINFRTYDLPAMGVLQLCDNKSNLASLYKLNQEVVGFDTIEECIDLTRHFLAHPEEQRRIALAGHRRWRKDYSPDRVWEKAAALVAERLSHPVPAVEPPLRLEIPALLAQRRKWGPVQRVLHQPVRVARHSLQITAQQAQRALRFAQKRLLPSASPTAAAPVPSAQPQRRAA